MHSFGLGRRYEELQEAGRPLRHSRRADQFA